MGSTHSLAPRVGWEALDGLRRFVDRFFQAPQPGVAEDTQR